MMSPSRVYRGIRRRLASPVALQVDEIRALHTVPNPRSAKAKVVFVALSAAGFLGPKLSRHTYLPAFSGALREAGLQTEFAHTVRGLKRAMSPDIPTIVVLIYKEVGFVPAHPGLPAILRSAAMVINAPQTGALVSNKIETNIRLTAVGIDMPRLIDATHADQVVFSNFVDSSSTEVAVLQPGEGLPPDKYNTEFIDTRVTQKGEDFYTMIRLMCVGGTITYTSPRARKTSEANPSVHWPQTPCDADFLNFVHDEVVAPRLARLEQIARDIAAELGPGFYSHDMLIDIRTERIALCETGFKFNNGRTERDLEPIAENIPFLKGFGSAEAVGRNSAPAFLETISPVLR